MKKKLNSALIRFYVTADEHFDNSLISNVRLNADIDEKILKNALQKTQQRYPYLSVKVINEGEGYELEENSLPFVLKKGLEPIELGSETSNGHLLALGFLKNVLSFQFVHSFMDGSGIIPFQRTLLYYYLSEKEGKEFDSSGIRTLEDPVLLQEWIDPYDLDYEEVKPLYTYQPVPHFDLMSLEENRQSKKEIYYNLYIPEKEMMDFARTIEASPASLITALLFKAISQVHPDHAEPIVAGMAFNAKPALKTPETFYSLSPLIHLNYKNISPNTELDRLNTITRGMVLLQTQPENAIDKANREKKSIEGFTRKSHAQRKEMASRIAKNTLSQDTFKISYVGKPDYGSLEPYIEDYELLVNIENSGIFVEMLVTKGLFNLVFMQEFENERYLNAFIDQLKKIGLSVQVEGPFDLKINRISFEQDLQKTDSETILNKNNKNTGSES